MNEQQVKKAIAAEMAKLDPEAQSRVMSKVIAQHAPYLNRSETVGDARNILSAFEQLSPERQSEIEEFPEVKAILQNRDLSTDERKAALRPYINKLEREMRENEASTATQLADLKGRKAALEAIQPWYKLPSYKLERNDCSRIHKIHEACKAGKLITPKSDEPPTFRDYALMWKDVHVFVVQHDWAAAFKNATDYTEGDFKLPFSVCAFEFRMSGRTVVIPTWQHDEQTASFPYIECPDGYWYCPGESATHDLVTQFAWEQVRAISIALDAEVAQHDVVRASTPLNQRRTKEGKMPLYDYHVVKLHGRIKYQRHPYGAGTHRSPRLHFRRGHWRHYSAHKAWIRWTLVGNPELGFIDKSYRL